MSEILGKSNGTTLKDHLHGVEMRCRELATQLLPKDVMSKYGELAGISSTDLINACGVAGLLHDIGKATPSFQEYLRNNGNEQPYTIDENPDSVEMTYKSTESEELRFHNETGWVFLELYKDQLQAFFGITNNMIWNAVLSSVFWHHGASHNYGTPTFTVADITLSKYFDLECLKTFTEDLIGTNLPERDIETFNAPIPQYLFRNRHQFKQNVLLTFIRTVLIRADRETSSNAYSDEQPRQAILDVNCPEHFDISRWNTQQEIVNNADMTTTVVSAPAGFGKTLVGLLWAIRHNRTAYWVCPRNVVVDNVFDELVDLVKTLCLNVALEKIYTGKLQDSYGNVSSKCPKIVVTNIDAVTSPFANNRIVIQQYDMLGCPIVFDEFHEFSVERSPMYAMFRLILSIRNRITSAPSLLVSATPTHIELFDGEGPRYLPERNKHYRPQHDKVYKIGIAKEFNARVAPGTFQVYSVVKDAQTAAMNNTDALCVHSKFTANDKDEHMQTLYSMYGKVPTSPKTGVTAGPIIRASLDISCNNIELMVCSPNADIQSIGRCNRWGESDNATITFVIPDKLDPGNKTYLDRNDFERTHDIYTAWTKFLVAHVKPEMSLVDLYSMLDAFYMEHRRLLDEYQQKLLDDGISLMASECYPRRYYSGNSDEVSSGSKTRGTIRNVDGSINFIVKSVDGHYVGPFQITKLSTEFGTKAFRDAFFPYKSTDSSKLNVVMESDSEFANNFPELYKYLTGKRGKVLGNRVQYYGTNSNNIWCNPKLPFIVRPSGMTYESRIGYRFLKADE